MDAEGRITFLDGAVRDVYGYEPRELLGRHFSELLWPEDVGPNAALFQELLRGGNPVVRYELRVRRRDGAVAHLSCNAVVFRDEQGRVLGTTGISADITARRTAEAALARSESRFRLMTEKSHEGVALIGPQGELAYVSEAIRELLGYRPAELVGQAVLGLVHPEDRPGLRQSFQAARAGATVPASLCRLRHREGRLLWIEVALTNLLDQPGVDAVAANFRDVSERVAVSEALRASEARFATIFRSSPAAIGIGSVDEGRLLLVNDRYLEFFGYTWEEMAGRTVGELGLWADPEDREAVVQRLRREGSLRDVEVRLRRKSGAVRDAMLSMEIVELPGEAQPLLIAMLVDVTERKRAADERERHARQLEALSRRLLEIQERERAEVARELHDEVGQLLTGLSWLIDVAGEPGSEARRQEMRRLVGVLIGRVRNLSMDLRPPVLDELGLEAALLWHVDRLRSQTGVRVDLQHAGLGRRLPATLELAVFRVVQEALTNVVRHSGAASARVRVRADGERVLASIEDEGIGMDSGVALSRGAQGLGGMRERVRLLGGRLTIQSALGRGTRVEAELPVAGSPEPDAR